MRVKFKDNWFGPSEQFNIGPNKSVSGVRYKKGERIVPDWLKPYLPKSAIVLDDPAPAPSPKEVAKQRLADKIASHDLERAGADNLEAYVEKRSFKPKE